MKVYALLPSVCRHFAERQLRNFTVIGSRSASIVRNRQVNRFFGVCARMWESAVNLLDNRL